MPKVKASEKQISRSEPRQSGSRIHTFNQNSGNLAMPVAWLWVALEVEES